MLTQLVLTNAKPKDKPYKLADMGGLHLLVTPAGARLLQRPLPIGTDLHSQ